MGSIQNSVNSSINSLALIITTAKGLARIGSAQEEAAKQAKRSVDAEVEAKLSMRERLEQQAKEIAERRESSAATPADRRLALHEFAQGRLRNTMAEFFGIDQNTKEGQEALDKLINEPWIKKSKEQPKRNFMDYLGKQPTDLGGTVADLPPILQKLIASQYSKKQRTALMDEMDKKQGGK